MADINSNNQRQLRKKSGIKKLTNLSTRIDLTPMVDLGFLLITFFILTNSLSEPKAMDVVMPKDSPITTNIPESGAMTIIPNGNHLAYIYEGQFHHDGANMHQVNFQQLRKFIELKKRKTQENKFFITIKPSPSSTYEDVVRVFDEMLVNDIKHFAMADIEKEEEMFVSNIVNKPF